MTEHTPGPWQAHDLKIQAKTLRSCDITDVKGGLIAKVWASGKMSNSTLIANARLIAGVPDLVVAAEELISWDGVACHICQGENGEHEAMMLSGVPCPVGTLQAAIAKARGLEGAQS